MRLIQIVPRTQVGDGVADYAALLAETLDARHAIPSHFVAAGAGPACLAPALEAANAADDALLLHYVGYGYAKRGAPRWLAQALERRRPGLRLGVVFHELYATGKPWQSSFWLSGLQKSIVTSIARACDFALVTREASRAWLEATGALGEKPVARLAISSNVGEPPEPAAPQRRPATAVVWGSAVARSNLYSRHAAALGAACHALGLAQIVDLGPSAAVPKSIAGVPVKPRGRLPAEELSRVLLEARCGALVYPASFLAKSTIFAAYAAHRLAPLVLDEPRTVPGDDLVADRHFLRLGEPGLGSASIDAIASHAHAWYAGHTVSSHAETIWRMAMQESP